MRSPERRANIQSGKDAPIAWHKAFRETLNGKLVEDYDVFVSDTIYSYHSGLQLRVLSVLSDNWAEAPRGLYLESNIAGDYNYADPWFSEITIFVTKKIAQKMHSVMTPEEIDKYSMNGNLELVASNSFKSVPAFRTDKETHTFRIEPRT